MKRLLILLLSLAVVISAVFSLSSCLGDINSIINSPSGDSSQDTPTGEGDGNIADGSGNVTPEQNPTTPPTDGSEEEKENDGSSDNTGSTENSGTEEGGSETEEPSAPPEFLPGSDTVSVSGKAKALLSVASIVCNFELSYGRTTTSVGSGVIYRLDKTNGNAYIITNYHVVYNNNATSKGGISDDISLYLYGMELNTYKIKASYVGGSLTQDLAVLKVEGSEVLKKSAARAADLGDSDKLAVLDSVIVVGNPEGYGLSATKGVVSVESESLAMTGADAQTELNLRVIRVDAAVNEGNSGGGLFDENGDLVGIVNAKRTGSEVDNIGYAIPISYAKNFAENIIYYCNGDTVTSPSKCLMGVTITAKVLGLRVDETTGKLYKVEAVEVDSLTAGSIAEGKLTAGDRITSITVGNTTKEVSRMHHIIDLVITAKVGDTITLEITRNGSPLTVSFTVTESAIAVVD